MELDQPSTAGPSRRKLLAATAGAAVGAGLATAAAAPATAATVQPMANSVVDARFMSGWGGAACIEFNINDMLAQGNLVCDVFVATGSTSPIILATGGAIGMSALSPYNATRHITVINAHPYTQGGRPGVRLRINFVGDNPQRDMIQRISIQQVGAQYFAPPERTLGAP